MPTRHVHTSWISIFRDPGGLWLINPSPWLGSRVADGKPSGVHFPGGPPGAGLLRLGGSVPAEEPGIRGAERPEDHRATAGSESVGDGSEAGGVLPGCSRRTLPFSWETNQGLLVLYGRAQQKSHIAY